MAANIRTSQVVADVAEELTYSAHHRVSQIAIDVCEELIDPAYIRVSQVSGDVVEELPASAHHRVSQIAVDVVEELVYATRIRDTQEVIELLVTGSPTRTIYNSQDVAEVLVSSRSGGTYLVAASERTNTFITEQSSQAYLFYPEVTDDLDVATQEISSLAKGYDAENLTQLSANISPTTTLLPVVSAAVFPLQTNRILIGGCEICEVLRLYRADNIIQVNRAMEGTSAGYRAAGTSVVPVVTAGGIDSLVSNNIILPSPIYYNPSALSGGERTTFSTTSLQRNNYGVSPATTALDTFPLHKVEIPDGLTVLRGDPLASGNAYDTSKGYIYMKVALANWLFVVGKGLPRGKRYPYQVTMGMLQNGQATNYSGFSVGIGETGGYNYRLSSVYAGGMALEVNIDNSDFSWNSTPWGLGSAFYNQLNGYKFMRIKNDGVTRYFQLGMDLYNWTTFYTTGATTNCTEDRFWIRAEAANGAAFASAAVFYLKVEDYSV